jgi:hypothetical protein
MKHSLEEGLFNSSLRFAFTFAFSSLFILLGQGPDFGIIVPTKDPGQREDDS